MTMMFIFSDKGRKRYYINVFKCASVFDEPGNILSCEGLKFISTRFNYPVTIMQVAS